MCRHTIMQGVIGREGRVACISVLLTDQEVQHQCAGTAREQENGLSGRYSIEVGRRVNYHFQRMRPGAYRQEAQTLRSEN
jgi:hypothetical protein